MVTDDEIGAIIQQLQPGVAFTMMMDCCHSGTLNRFGVGDPAGASGIRDERARFPAAHRGAEAGLPPVRLVVLAQRAIADPFAIPRRASGHQRGPVHRVPLDRGGLRIQWAGRVHGSGDATAERSRRRDDERRVRQCRHQRLWLGAPADADDHVCRGAPGPAGLPGLRRRAVTRRARCRAGYGSLRRPVGAGSRCARTGGSTSYGRSDPSADLCGAF